MQSHTKTMLVSRGQTGGCPAVPVLADSLEGAMTGTPLWLLSWAGSLPPYTPHSDPKLFVRMLLAPGAGLTLMSGGSLAQATKGSHAGEGPTIGHSPPSTMGDLARESHLLSRREGLGVS